MANVQNVKSIQELLIERNSKRFVSQTTHLICAKCGGDTSFSNRELLPFRVENEEGLLRLYFHCNNCNDEYDLGLLSI